MSDQEPWKDTMAWAWSDVAIAIGRVKVAIGRAVPGAVGLRLETKAITEIYKVIQWQEKEVSLFKGAGSA